MVLADEYLIPALLAA